MYKPIQILDINKLDIDISYNEYPPNKELSESLTKKWKWHLVSIEKF